MGLTRTTDAATEPVSTAEVKEFLRIDSGDSSQDNILGILIKSARQQVEEYIRRSLINQTWTWEVSSRELLSPIFLPRVPVSSITSFTVYDENAAGAETSSVVDTANYQLVEGQKIVERNDGWDINRREKAATIVYVAGYGANASDVPSPIRSAILRLVASNYEFREDRRSNRSNRGADAMPVEIGMETLVALDDFRYGGL